MARSTPKIMRSMFAHHRLTWGPRAAYHLARVFNGPDWPLRLISAGWLARERVPLDGRWPPRKRRAT